MRYFVIGLLICALLLCTANCWVYFTLSWDPPLDDMRNNISIYGYRFYYSTTQSGPPYTGTYSTRGPSPIDIPVTELDLNNPNFSAGFPSCTQHWGALTAYNLAESGYSNEVSFIGAEPPTQVRATVDSSGNIVLSWVGLSGGATDPGTINSYLIYYDFNNGDPFTSNWTGTGATQGDSPIRVLSSQFTNSWNPTFTLSGLTNAPIYFMIRSQCSNGAVMSKLNITSTATLTEITPTSPPQSVSSPTANEIPFWVWIIVGGSGLLVSGIVILLVLLVRRRKRKQRPQQSTQMTTLPSSSISSPSSKREKPEESSPPSYIPPPPPSLAKNETLSTRSGSPPPPPLKKLSSSPKIPISGIKTPVSTSPKSPPMFPKPVVHN